ncbi:leucyl/phenylalanyl-tRNA--protein transferase [Salipiger aestuarii]|uniref:Leucyl/phenylalanyl-tRNA--protein transferase n=1 Tax=Salipiger aestuarii TaxID=568098 RepID=A0A327XRG4_9RHOB|nr:leucyl/phenylalanyl-tRNA--protein transferase [Salipiger aestuarii]EIE49382.1 leucyl/phenylalanyl-tRNA--protein transferase [Citreicella sp. 357]KAA8605044.1 leucyl/phenylalanyl-tRNA--protein transferase [Salipiger aestuarii]KAA8606755.1 leucyl/phenylalanyl-tRNA--protein transferase [Salipiger aestuarii]KAB2534088.1 leucyl/phenylalanyl-tRNA--protein transferase [Salipiger aestuarii]RAK09905.1 leucyl/phenylalanyl-tRNA--protein transferase [Salipiger aestuarii]
MNLSADQLLLAYRSGIFPMAEHRDDPELFWVDPRRRGIIPLDGLHVSRSLGRRLKRDDYRVTVDTAFEQVIDACADRPETWINPEIRRMFAELHRRGVAHSLEVWIDGHLAGGVYGIEIGAAFCGESMFSRRRDGSKIALCWLVDLCRRAGFTLFDTQFLTDHLGSLGAIEISRMEYRLRLRDALSRTADFAGTPLPLSGQDVVQRNTQTS